MINLILFGPPGSGKGTQAAKLADKYNLIHISTGDLFRYELSNETPLGKLARTYMDEGHLVPDEVTIGMLKAKMERHPEANGFIFDGFPRNIAQSEALITLLKEKNTSLTAMIALEVDEEEIVSRITSRGLTSGRADDNNEEIIRRRFEVYNEETSPVFEYFSKLGLASSLKGVGDIDDIFKGLVEKINRALDHF